MKYKIGDIVPINGEWYQCVEGRCKDCYFSEKRYLCKQFITKDFCTSGIIFKKLEKVGESYDFQKRTFQTYKLHTTPFLSEDVEFVAVPSKDNNTIEIEIKQNKEDMEENKTPLPKEDNHLTRTVYAYVNGKISDKELIKSIKEMSDEYPYYKNGLKPFDLEAAKAGKPVCTRDGRKARIICFDIKDKDNPIAAAVYVGECESVYLFTNKGEYNKGKEDELDLMMLPEKKEGWVNIYHDREDNIYTDENVYNREKDAINFCPHDKCRIATVKVEWEE